MRGCPGCESKWTSIARTACPRPAPSKSSTYSRSPVDSTVHPFDCSSMECSEPDPPRPRYFLSIETQQAKAVYEGYVPLANVSPKDMEFASPFDATQLEFRKSFTFDSPPPSVSCIDRAANAAIFCARQ